ncbi:MAG TPA: hypothetical protein VGQ36_00630 [Thermoanaerobaculia bacterium]|jgi:hypothetical protein|nr:hypothetical protein [Thermoanaerobaculia bacterium]
MKTKLFPSILMTRSRLITDLVAVLFIALSATVATAQMAQMPLNTGFNYGGWGPYQTVITPVSATPDNYWINIASYPPTIPSVKRTFVLQTPILSWQTSLPASHWISARDKADSDPGVTPVLPGYTIYRKCFCLQDFSAPLISFTLRADDTVQVWFNSQVNVMLPPQTGNWNTTAITSLPSKSSWFRTGTNCLYALVEDFLGLTGFDLSGTVTVTGPAPIPAFGTTPTYPCGCTTNPNPNGVEASASEDDSEVVAALIEIAEERRHARSAFPRR